MTLNFIWIAFFLISFVVALIKLLFFGDTGIFKTVMDGVFDAASTGVQISIGLIGIMSLFLGFMKVGERAGAIRFLSRLVSPFFGRLFPEVPRNHPALGQMMMNFAANFLGLDNAATPFALKAMEDLQELNPEKERASNAQIMFLVLHASGLTLIPTTIIAQRVIMKSANPTSIFVPGLIATFAATLVALIVVSIRQRIRLLQPVILAWIGGFILVIVVMIAWLSAHRNLIDAFSQIVSNGLILLLFIVFLLGGLWKRINVYESFLDGAKGGFDIAVKIIPYLVGMLVAISVLRTCGILDYLTDGFRWVFGSLGINTDFVRALPTALMRPLSASASRAMMLDNMKQYGPDSFTGILSSVFQGSSDTTFYVVALYFGAVGIRQTRYTIPAALLADLAGIITAIVVSYFFFH